MKLPLRFSTWHGTAIEDADGKAVFVAMSRDDAMRIISNVNEHFTLVCALTASERLFDEALPKFNWGASALDANAIYLLNNVPEQVRRALLGVPRPQP